MDGARHQLLPGARFAENQHVCARRRDHFHLAENPSQSRAVAHHLLEVLLAFNVLLSDTFDLIARPEILNERDPLERRKLQHRRGNQNRNPAAVLAEQFLLERRAGSESQDLFMRQIVQGGVLGGSEVWPTQTSSSQIIPAIPDQVKEGIIGVGNAVKLPG